MKRNPLRKIVEEQYSRKIYPKIAKKISSISNKTNLNLGGLIFSSLVGTYFAENYPRIVGKVLERYYDIANHGLNIVDNVSEKYHTFLALDFQETISNTLSSCNGPTGYVAAAMFTFAMPAILNRFREKLSSKLELKLSEPTEKEREENIKHCERGIRENYIKEMYDEQKATKMLHKKLNELIKQIEGVKTAPLIKPKQSALSPLLRKIGILGIFYLPTQEINIFEKKLIPNHILAHELAHGAGYLNESEAQFMGYLTAVHSQSQGVKLDGYAARLVGELLSSKTTKKEDVKKVINMDIPNKVKAEFATQYVKLNIPVISSIRRIILPDPYSVGFTKLLTAFERKYGRDGERYFK